MDFFVVVKKQNPLEYSERRCQQKRRDLKEKKVENNENRIAEQCPGLRAGEWVERAQVDGLTTDEQGHLVF